MYASDMMTANRKFLLAAGSAFVLVGSIVLVDTVLIDRETSVDVLNAAFGTTSMIIGALGLSRGIRKI